MPPWEWCPRYGGNLYYEHDGYSLQKTCLLCARSWKVGGNNLKYAPCPVPGCNRNISITSKFGVCAKHTELFSDLNYYFQRMQKEANATRKKGGRPGELVSPGGIILPR